MNVNEIPYPAIRLLQCVANEEPRSGRVSDAQSSDYEKVDSVDLLEQLVTAGLLEIAGRNKSNESYQLTETGHGAVRVFSQTR